MLRGFSIMFVGKRLAVCAALALTLSGCAGSIQNWIVNTRVHQGDVSLANGNVADAELAYRLALKVDPKDERARAGFVEAAAGLAQSLYTKGNFDDAIAAINDALKYDPQSVRLSALKTTIEEAKLKREIVISNYPTYREAGVSIQRAYEQLNVMNKDIVKNLKRFSYTYDPQDLTAAIKQSYELQLDVVKNTNRLISYRQIVQSGVPVAAPQGTAAGAASLLPLP
jgi:tetratricopeptide (TPR) repeat protein